MITFDYQKCTGCRLCTEDCFFSSIKIKDGLPVLQGKCIQCGHCFALCPQNAIQVSGYPSDDVEDADRYGQIAPQQLLHTLKMRRSIRRYQRKAVEAEKLEMILQAGRYTATGANSQEFRFVVIQQEMASFRQRLWSGVDALISSYQGNIPENMRSLAAALERYKADPKDDRILWGAPCAILIASDHKWAWDAGMASQSMELMAVSQGLGMLYNGYLLHTVESNADLKAWLGIAGVSVKTAMVLGYPLQAYKRSAPRKAAHVIWR